MTALEVVTKTCGTCRIPKDLSEYSIDRRRKDGRTARCKACRRAYYRENRETILARQKLYYAENREARLEQQRQYRDANRDSRLAYMRRYCRENREAKAEYDRKYREHNRDAIRERDAANRDVILQRRRTNEARRRARMAKIPTVPYTVEQFASRMAYWGERCWMCSGPFEQVDHVKPISAGGADMLCNLRPSCGYCNRSKKNKWPFPLVGLS